MSADLWIFRVTGRILISFMFLQSGINKIGGYKATLGYMESKGVPGMLLPFVILLEIVGAIAVIVGWQARLFSFPWPAFASWLPCFFIRISPTRCKPSCS